MKRINSLGDMTELVGKGQSSRMHSVLFLWQEILSILGREKLEQTYLLICFVCVNLGAKPLPCLILLNHYRVRV